MSLRELRWRRYTNPNPQFAVGDEVCYWESTIRHTNKVLAVRETTSIDGDETYREIKVEGNDWWYPARYFVRVRRDHERQS